MAQRVTIRDVKRMKARGERFAMVTAYDYPTARLIGEAGIPLILVGDSLGMTVLGYESTLPVSLDDILHHTKAVVRGAEQALIVADLPFLTYQISADEALRNAGRLMQEGGAGAVKLEGGRAVVDTVSRIVEAGIPVMGHLGLTPQAVHQFGGYRIQARTLDTIRELIADARALEEAGAFALVLEVIPAPVAQAISEHLTIPTIGIGAGPGCDGQVQVFSDLLHLESGSVPRHAEPYLDLASLIPEALGRYQNDVQAGTFPTDKHSFSLSENIDPASLAALFEEQPDEE